MSVLEAVTTRNVACVGNSIMGSRQMFRRGVLSDIFNEASLNNMCVFVRGGSLMDRSARDLFA